MGQSNGHIVAVLGESQVGKSTLINALVDQPVLPTTGQGSSCSLVPCVCRIPSLPVKNNSLWMVEPTWCTTSMLLNGEFAQERREKLVEGPTQALSPFLQGILQALGSNDLVRHLELLAFGRALPTLPKVPVPLDNDYLGLLELLISQWPAALVSSVQVSAQGGSSVTLVDLPGVGQPDLGALTTQAWLRKHAKMVSVVLCVLGPNGMGEALANQLQETWTCEELADRICLVATYADSAIVNAKSSEERDKVALIRRNEASKQAAKLLNNLRGPLELLHRCYCVDPRRAGFGVDPVDFGELERLREALLPASPRGHWASNLDNCCRIKLDPKLFEKAKRAAKNQGVELSEYITMVVNSQFDAEEDEEFDFDLEQALIDGDESDLYDNEEFDTGKALYGGSGDEYSFMEEPLFGDGSRDIISLMSSYDKLTDDEINEILEFTNDEINEIIEQFKRRGGY